MRTYDMFLGLYEHAEADHKRKQFLPFWFYICSYYFSLPVCFGHYRDSAVKVVFSNVLKKRASGAPWGSKGARRCCN